MRERAIVVAIGKASLLALLGLAAVILAPIASAQVGATTTGKIVLKGVAVGPGLSITFTAPGAGGGSGGFSTVDLSNVLSSVFSSQLINTATAGASVGSSVGPAPVTVLPVEKTVTLGNLSVKSYPFKDYVYTTSVQSLNGKMIGSSSGVLTSRDAGNNNAVVYTVTLGGRDVSMNGGVGAGPNGTLKAGSGPVDLPVSITLHLSPLLQAGTYSDVLSFNIAGN